MTKKTIKSIQKQKGKRKITCLTAYTSSVAKIIDNYVDIILIGDSLGSTIYGMKNTQKVTLDMMRVHGKAVSQFCKKSFTIIDMPFNTYKNAKQALQNCKKVMNLTKCDGVKLEGGKKIYETIKTLVKNKIPVMGHLGLLPQSDKTFKFKGKKKLFLRIINLL